MSESAGIDSFFWSERCRRPIPSTCVEETGSVAAKPSGGSIPPLEQHAEFLLGLISNQPDLTLGRDRRGDAQPPDRRQPQRGMGFFARRNISFKKICTRRSRSVRT
jgi:hypothetical protein